MIHPTGRSPVDLLPWADPYILQLFAEAELVRAEDETASRTGMQVTAGGEANAEAVFAGDGWRVTSLRHSPASRRQRTESGRQLAAC